MMTLEEQQAHYAAVRRRISGAPPPKPVVHARVPPKPWDHYVEIEPFVFPIPSPQRFQRLVRNVCKAYGRDASFAFHRGRKSALVHMKFEIYYHLTRSGFGYAETGRWLNVDHTSVLHGVRRMTEMLARGEYELRFVPADAEAAGSEGDAAGDGADDREDVLCADGDARCPDHVPVRGGAELRQQADRAMG